MENKTWHKLHQPCPLCKSSDAVGINEDGSAKCFSCGEFMPNYNNSCEGKDMVQQTTTNQTICKNTMNPTTHKNTSCGTICQQIK